MSEQLIFVETSIQIQRILADISQQGLLQQRIQRLAIQVPDDAAVWTLDTDFAPIVDALRLDLYAQ